MEGILTIHVYLALLVVSWFILISGIMFVTKKTKPYAARHIGTEPPILPYWIPIFGHALQVLLNPEKSFREAKERFGVLNPFTLYLFGVKIHFFKSASDVAEIFRKSKSLDFNPFMLWFVRDICGMSSRGVHQIEEGPFAQSLIHKAHISFHENISKSLHDITGKYLEELRRVIAEVHGSPSTTIITTDIPETKSKENIVSCYKWTRQIIGIASVRTMFGRKLVDELPDIMSMTFDIENGLPKLAARCPYLGAREAYNARDSLLDALQNYELDSDILQPSMAEFIRRRTLECKESGLTNKDLAAQTLGLLIATQTNTSTAAFWVLAHIITDPSLMKSVREEIDSAYTVSTALSSGSDLKKYLLSSALLNSVLNEVLRFYGSAATFRFAVEATKIGKYDIAKGSVVIAPVRQTNLDKSIWGADSALFKGDRFVLDPLLAKSPYFRPFGGGKTKCPGSLLAKHEIFLLVAELLKTFEFKVDPNCKFPMAEEGKYGGGVLEPENMGKDFNMQLTRRSKLIASQ